MKKILTLALLLVSVVTTYASDFTDKNKKYSDGAVYTVAAYADGVSVATATQASAINAFTAFGYGDGDKLYYIEGAVSRYIALSGATPTRYDGTPSEGDNYLVAASSDENYVALFDNIIESENSLNSLKKENHAALGSKFADAAQAAQAYKNMVPAISNDNPYVKLNEAIGDAIVVFGQKGMHTNTYGEAAESMKAAKDGYKDMFDELEEMRDSLVLFYQTYDGKKGKNGEDLPRKISEYPSAKSMVEDIEADPANGIEAAEGTWSTLLKDYKEAESYSIINGDMTLIQNTLDQLYDNVERYDDETLAFFDKMNDPSSYVPAESHNEYPTIDNISYAEYALFVKVPAMQMVEAGKTFGKEVAAWAGTAPFVSYSGIALATATFAIDMTFAGMLMAENIKHIMTLQDCITWLNEECQDDYAYAFLKEEVARSRMNLRSCNNSSIAELQHGILKDALARAKELSALGVKQLELQNLIFQAQDLYYGMSAKRNNDYDQFANHISKANLRTCLSAAEIQKNINYVIKIKTYDYEANGGSYSLYNFEWYASNGVSFSENNPETPAQIVTREITKLQNAMALYSAQYNLEEKLDEVIEYMNDETLFANPKRIITNAWTAGEEFNDLVSQNKKLVADIENEIQALNDALALAENHQTIIEEEIQETEDIIDELVNNGPEEKLSQELLEAIEAFKNGENDSWDKVQEIILDLTDKRNWDSDTFDDPDYYLDYMIDNVQTFYDANAAKFTPTQVLVLDQALAVGRIALAEYRDQRYQDLDQLMREYVLFRMWCSALALEYAEKLTVSETGLEDEATKQLEEALVLAALTAAAQYTGDIAEFKAALAEANGVYRDDEATAEAKFDQVLKLRALLGDNLTGINSIEKAAKAMADGKYIENGKLVIVKDGKKFRANGVAF